MMQQEKTEVKFTIEELESLIQRVVDKTLNNISIDKSGSLDRILYSRREAATLLHVSLVTLNNWNKSGFLKPSKIGERVLYTEEQITKALNNKSED